MASGDVYYYTDDESMSEEKRAYIEELDEVFCKGYGAGLEKSDFTMFEIGFKEWLNENGKG